MRKIFLIMFLLLSAIAFEQPSYGSTEIKRPYFSHTDIIVNDLLDEAHKYIGTKYVWGANGPKAFDCSGYTSYIYKQLGYQISRTSKQQYTEGIIVDRYQLKKGDLVFFTRRGSGQNVGHVGIVVSANNETGDFSFIHASVSGVKVSDCIGYYERRYVGAKRIII